MRRITALLLAGLAALTLTGCRRGPGLLPYAREIEDMELMQTLGVDRAGEGQVEVTASSGSGDPAEGAATVVSGQAGTISAAVLGMQGEGSSYLYFGHVGQLLLGEELARQGVEPALDYILRDVETRLDTALYLVRGGTAGKAITAAGETAPPLTGWRRWRRPIPSSKGSGVCPSTKTPRAPASAMRRCGALPP